MITNCGWHRQSGGDEAQEHQHSEHLDAVCDIGSTLNKDT
jgi:hypothetical protein